MTHDCDHKWQSSVLGAAYRFCSRCGISERIEETRCRHTVLRTDTATGYTACHYCGEYMGTYAEIAAKIKASLRRSAVMP